MHGAALPSTGVLREVPAPRPDRVRRAAATARHPIRMRHVPSVRVRQRPAHPHQVRHVRPALRVTRLQAHAVLRLVQVAVAARAAIPPQVRAAVPAVDSAVAAVQAGQAPAAAAVAVPVVADK